MPLAVADRVKETSTTTGTGDITLAGAATGFQTFNTAYGAGPPFEYTIELQSGSEWEVGRGHLSDATTLVRDFIDASSNSNAAVNFSAGTKNVFTSLSARTQRTVDPSAFTGRVQALP